MAGKPYSFKKDEGSPKMLIGLLVILILIVGAALLYVVMERTTEGPTPIEPANGNETNVTQTNETNVTQEYDDDYYYEKAIEEENFSACQNITNTTLQQDCYWYISGASEAACLSLEDFAKKEICVTAFAVSLNDLSFCEHLGNESDACKLAVDPCKVEEDPELCRALMHNDPEKCGGNSLCLLNYSVTMGDEEGCALIQNNVISTACLASVQRTDKCYDLEIQSEKDYCYQLYATYTNNYLICTQVTDNTLYALNCYSLFAGKLNDLSICDMDGLGLNNQWDCYTNCSLISGDLQGCEQIHELATTHKFNCAFQYAKKYGNPGACELVESLPSRDTCYQATMIYSSENLNWTFCADISDFNWRNKCYTESAKLYDDPTLCEYASEDFAKEACHIAYTVYKNGEEE